MGLVCLPNPFVYSGAHVRSHEHVDKIRIELGAAPLLHRAHRFSKAASVAVASTVRDRVEAVGDGYHAGDQWNSPSFESAGISLPIPAFVVGGHSLGQVWKECLQRSENFGAALRVRHHGPALLGGELRFLVKNIRQRAVKLADIVEKSDALNAAERTLVQTGFLS
ncbi:MAG: hypothetical protein QOD47_1566 [Gemmatimonadaceae bacterium]|jgi:hypothetical protein|nr:hypothetical protein [Gemmatimonadaceae bacterium]